MTSEQIIRRALRTAFDTRAPVRLKFKGDEVCEIAGIIQAFETSSIAFGGGRRILIEDVESVTFSR